MTWSVAVDGGQVTVLGEASPHGTLVVVPGVMSDARDWSAFVQALPGRPSVVVNRRGRAPSSPQGEKYSVELEIADLHAVLDAIPGRKDLLGWSYGGLIAAETATRREDVRSLVLYEPVSGPFAEHVSSAVRDAAQEADLDRLVEIVNIEIAGYDHDRVRSLRETSVWAHLRLLAQALPAEHAALNAFTPHYERYRALRIPVDILAGTLSAAAGGPYAEALDRFVSAMPQAHLTWMEGLSHLAHVEAPAVLAAHLHAIHDRRGS
ncbi:alpha/beta fold hydrolase [Micromonospora echinaurantiaca]|uniref:alpha/beta fold hydrolase n=1 Tax=Micromonospora echinaurantiaca TaxID=47857 RepID=UPI0037209F6E